jgi:hypothetical protein
MSETEISPKRAERFLEMLEKMSPDSQRAFRKIYKLAPKEKVKPMSIFSGHHVRVAMMEALIHPQIAYWVKMNLAFRVARKLSQTTSRLDKAERLSALLEEFHIATDAFILKISIDLAIEHRRHLQRFQASSSNQENRNSGITEEEIAQIREFKRQIIPGFIRAIREKSSLEREVIMKPAQSVE